MCLYFPWLCVCWRRVGLFLYLSIWLIIVWKWKQNNNKNRGLSLPLTEPAEFWSPSSSPDRSWEQAGDVAAAGVSRGEGAVEGLTVSRSAIISQHKNADKTGSMKSPRAWNPLMNPHWIRAIYPQALKMSPRRLSGGFCNGLNCVPRKDLTPSSPVLLVRKRRFVHIIKLTRDHMGIDWTLNAMTGVLKKVRGRTQGKAGLGTRQRSERRDPRRGMPDGQAPQEARRKRRVLS